MDTAGLSEAIANVERAKAALPNAYTAQQNAQAAFDIAQKNKAAADARVLDAISAYNTALDTLDQSIKQSKLDSATALDALAKNVAASLADSKVGV